MLNYNRETEGNKTFSIVFASNSWRKLRYGRESIFPIIARSRFCIDIEILILTGIPVLLFLDMR